MTFGLVSSFGRKRWRTSTERAYLTHAVQPLGLYSLRNHLGGILLTFHFRSSTYHHALQPQVLSIKKRYFTRIWLVRICTGTGARIKQRYFHRSPSALCMLSTACIPFHLIQSVQQFQAWISWAAGLSGTTQETQCTWQGDPRIAGCEWAEARST